MNATRWRVLIAAGILLAFLIDFGWQYGRAERLEQTLNATRRALALSHLEGAFGAAVIEAQRGSYEVSRQLMSEFFSGLQRSVSDAPPDARETLTSILSRRDAVITFLARGDPESGNLLSRMFIQYRAALHTRPPARPTAAGRDTGSQDGTPP